MIVEILKGAHWLDQKLQQKLGRPYRVALTIVLVNEIVYRINEVLEAPHSNSGVVQIVLAVGFGLLLVINQMGELSKRIEKRNSSPLDRRAKGADDRRRQFPGRAGQDQQ